MKTQTRSVSRESGTAYREFSRRRYTQLKARSPNLRESEIVQKIIQEWDGLSMEQRNSFKVENPAVTPVKYSTKLAKPDQANLRTTGAKSLVDQPERSQKISDQLNLQDLDPSSKALFPSDTPVTKPIKKAGKSQDYMTFYKFYFAKFKRDHPNWTSNPVTIIIKLMWKKRCLSLRKNGKLILRKPRSARKTFSQFQHKKGLTTVQITESWKHMPVQSKIRWFRAGNPTLKTTEPSTVRSTMKLRMGARQDSRPLEDRMEVEEIQVTGNQLNFLNRR